MSDGYGDPGLLLRAAFGRIAREERERRGLSLNVVAERAGLCLFDATCSRCARSSCMQAVDASSGWCRTLVGCSFSASPNPIQKATTARLIISSGGNRNAHVYDLVRFYSDCVEQTRRVFLNPLPRCSLCAVRRSLLIAAAVAACVLALTAVRASAAIGPFCPPNSGTMGLYAYGTAGNRDRCAHGYHNGVVWIEYQNYTTPVEKCAVLKTNSDGSGANVGGLAAGCTRSTLPADQYPPSLSGYATGINKGANYHTGFEGVLQYL